MIFFRRLRHLHRLLAVLLLAWLGLAQGPARAGMVLQLADRQGTVEAWPAVQMLIAATATLGFMASMAGVLDYRQTQTLATALGPMPMLLAIPVAFRQARQRDRVAVYMLLGWLAYRGGALTITALLRGLLPVNFWTQHGFQFASLMEMLAWMRVLSLRIEGIRRDAERTELERAARVSLAHTDPLTGLPNRRGLQQSLATTPVTSCWCRWANG